LSGRFTEYIVNDMERQRVLAGCVRNNRQRKISSEEYIVYFTLVSSFTLYG
jgi:hypothetical protein